MFTIQNLLDKIKKEGLDTSLPIGVVGHFGEFFPLDEYDFQIRESYDDIPLDKQRPWSGRKERIKLKILEISVPDIGEYPE